MVTQNEIDLTDPPAELVEQALTRIEAQLPRFVEYVRANGFNTEAVETFGTIERAYSQAIGLVSERVPPGDRQDALNARILDGCRQLSTGASGPLLAVAQETARAIRAALNVPLDRETTQKLDNLVTSLERLCDGGIMVAEFVGDEETARLLRRIR